MDNDSNNSSEKPAKKTKKISGFYLLGAVLLVALIATFRSSIPTIECNEEILSTNPEVIMYGTWWCPYCKQAKQYLHSNNIHYCEYDIESSAIGKQRYDEIEATAIPVLVIGKYYLQGFDRYSIDEALRLSRANNESTR